MQKTVRSAFSDSTFTWTDQSEADSQEASPQQVAQSCKVGDGEVIRVQSPLPEPADHQVGHVEQNGHLDEDDGMGFSLQGNWKSKMIFMFWPEAEQQTGST